MTAEPIGPSEGDGRTSEREWALTDARGRLPELVDDVRDGDILFLTRYGRRVAALVPPDVAENYERMEDAYWGRRATEALERNEPAVPWDEAVAELERDARQ
ncbi:prevent-host-death family protein [Spinactinospora alkalitolerans]|uniref:Prevent-host-death family protein n=1 Tax=Spinactinospora alkalitolerans TaxID=687207 RepID=A0A852TU15_9ACTN|nr:type II toxin-antitoxin system prevent-host-death family antitoxin [Spinactinospora alkalitolerans]NYE47428.1 prevent-host-death family protein [Spinactinospora alkalitolerans]